MKGLPRAIVLGLLSSLAGEGKEYPVPWGSRDGHQPIGIGIVKLRGFLFLEAPAPKAVSPGPRYWGVGSQGPRPLGLPHLPGSAQTARLWCRVWFQDKLRCHPERPADRQGSRPLSKTPFHLPGLITPAEQRRGHWSQPPPSSPIPAPKPPASGTLLLPPFCLV